VVAKHVVPVTLSAPTPSVHAVKARVDGPLDAPVSELRDGKWVIRAGSRVPWGDIVQVIESLKRDGHTAFAFEAPDVQSATAQIALFRAEDYPHPPGCARLDNINYGRETWNPPQEWRLDINASGQILRVGSKTIKTKFAAEALTNELSSFSLKHYVVAMAASRKAPFASVIDATNIALGAQALMFEFSERDDSRPARALGNFDCAFPAAADPAGIDSTSAEVEIVVSAGGEPQAVRVLRDPGHDFGKAAQACAQAAKYAPATDANGTPFVSNLRMRVHFQR
jgi:TonB family protein